MFWKRSESEQTLAAERGRSPSDAASVCGGAGGPTPAAAVDGPQVVPPAETTPPLGTTTAIEQALAGAPASAPGRRRLRGRRARGRRAAARRAFRGGPQASSGRPAQEQGAAVGQARAVAATGDDARAAVVDPRHLAAERPAGGRFRPPGGPLQAHALQLEEAF